MSGLDVADQECGGGSDRDHAKTNRQGPLARHRRDVHSQDQRRDQEDRKDAAEVVDWVGRLIDVGRDVAPGQKEGDREPGAG